MDLSHINSPHFDTAVRYAEDIANKRILANEDRVLACRRFLTDLERDDLDFRSDQFDFVINLIEGTIHHVQGEDKNGVSFKAKDISMDMFGDDGDKNVYMYDNKGRNNVDITFNPCNAVYDTGKFAHVIPADAISGSV